MSLCVSHMGNVPIHEHRPPPHTRNVSLPPSNNASQAAQANTPIPGPDGAPATRHPRHAMTPPTATRTPLAASPEAGRASARPVVPQAVVPQAVAPQTVVPQAVVPRASRGRPPCGRGHAAGRCALAWTHVIHIDRGCREAPHRKSVSGARPSPFPASGRPGPECSCDRSVFTVIPGFMARRCRDRAADHAPSHKSLPFWHTLAVAHESCTQ